MPRRRTSTLTSAYSSSAANTNTRHTDIQTSIALTYDTRGIDALMLVDWVVVVSTVSRPMTSTGRRSAAAAVWSVRDVSRPMETRAGLASTLIQNETHERMTTSRLGR